ncbi:hypothetical protein J7E83_01960 [Arthrobacter sp. ISL-48]|uniref:hypothetical protein n=1 Tax=Arthrobacter sp. ISL-48 TaxID=2819110 RepID=UPI001BED0719|nr:hypothetical protein [Arthrobacter sp. ISL-48]MBT2530907.1 hypothetical protein [Arthrobacter sp. ISL-48]
MTAIAPIITAMNGKKAEKSGMTKPFQGYGTGIAATPQLMQLFNPCRLERGISAPSGQLL